MKRLVEFRGTAPGDAIQAFRQVPYLVYREDPVWSPQSETAIDDCLEWAAEGSIACRGFVVCDGDRPVARAMAIADPTVAAGPDLEGWVGLFECDTNTPGAGVEVLEACSAWLSETGVGRAVGPRVDGLRSGLLTGGEPGPHTIFTPHNPLHYVKLFEDAGFAVRSRMLSFVFHRDTAPKFQGLGSERFNVRAVDPASVHEEIARIEAFQANMFMGRPGYVRRDGGGSGRMVKALLPHIDTDLIVIATDRSDNTVGVLICLPDTWSDETPPSRARLLSIGVSPSWQGKQVAMSMGSLLKDTLLEKGYQTLEASWILKENRRPQVLARLLHAQPSREFCLLTADL